jgi:foldase protein PrsA
VKRSFAVLVLLFIACSVGIVCGRLTLRSSACRDVIGVLFGRGHLLALAHGHGIYAVDVERARAERREAGENVQDRHQELIEQGLLLEEIIAAIMAESFATDEKIPESELSRELDLVRSQFTDERSWQTALKRNHLSLRRLRRNLIAHLRVRRWVLHEVRLLNPSPANCQAFYDAHPQSFLQPERFRASHLFLAAPPETPPEIVDLKEKAITSFSERLRHGEDFFELVAEASEDEATKARGGDLGFFSESRMPPAFVAAVRAMRVGEISRPVRTQMGFHIIQLTDSRPARQMSFDEARAEISLALENAKLAAALRSMSAQLSGGAQLVRRLP